jgi:hypothetical protein
MSRVEKKSKTKNWFFPFGEKGGITRKVNLDFV